MARARPLALARHAWWLLPALFVLALLPLLPIDSSFRGDEVYYTDAATRMHETGDWLTPTYPDGSLRFNKPILTYWLVAGGMAIGPGFFGARLPFLLCGGLVLGLTWLLAWRAFSCARTATVAGLVLVSTPLFADAAIRSIPDIVLTAAIALSACGFVALLRGDAGWRWGAAAYLGVALAIQAKGLLGLLPLGVAWTVALAAGDGSWRRLWRPGWMLLGASLALSWFVAVYLRHGGAALGGFFSDQVGQRLHDTRIPSAFAHYSLGYLRLLLPWTLLLALVCWRQRESVRTILAGDRAVLWFLAGLPLLALVVFSCGNMVRTRYLLPAFPLAAVLLARVLVVAWDDGGLRRALPRLAATVSGVAIGAGAALAIAAGVMGLGGMLVLGGCALALGGWIAFAATRAQRASAFVVCGLLPLLAIVVSGLTIRTWANASPVGPLRTRIVQVVPAGAGIGLVGVDAVLAGHLRLCLHGRNPVLDQPRPDVAAVVLGPDAEPPQGWRVEQIGTRVRRFDWPELRDILRGESRQAVLARLSVSYRLAHRPTPPGGLVSPAEGALSGIDGSRPEEGRPR